MNKSTSALALVMSLLSYFASQAQPAMGTTSFQTNNNVTLVSVTSCTGGQTATTAGFEFYLRSGNNCAINNANSIENGSDGHINLITTPIATNPNPTGFWLEGRIGSANGSEFQINTLWLSTLTNPFLGKTITFTGYRDGLPVPEATLISPPFTTTGIGNIITVTFNKHFTNIDQIRMTPSGSDAQGTISIHAIDISPANTALPLTFKSVAANYIPETGIVVSFETAEESMVKDYEIQASIDGTNYVTYERLNAKNGPLQQYQAILNNIAAPSVWIRIAANDLDGAIKYSHIMLVQQKAESLLSIYPNPATNSLAVPGANNKAYRILNAQGKELQKGQILGEKIDISQLPAGMLFIYIDNRAYKVVKLP